MLNCAVKQENTKVLVVVEAIARIRAIVCLLVLIVGGCVSPRNAGVGSTHIGTGANIKQLIVTLKDCSAGDQTRRRADRSLCNIDGPNSSIRLAALKDILRTPGQHAAMRVYALKEIVAVNPSLAIKIMHAYLPHWQQWPVLIYACELAVRLDQRQLIGPLILSLKRPAKRFDLTHRPEAHAIEKLSGKSLAGQLAFTVFGHGPILVRIAALELLRKIKGAVFAGQLLVSSKSVDPMITDLRWWMLKFSYVPQSSTEILWIQEC